MKKKILFFCTILLAVLCACGKTELKPGEFSIEAKAKGLAVGDTVIIDEIAFYDWRTAASDSIIVSKEDEFEYIGKNDGARIYMVRLNPKGTQPFLCYLEGLELFINKGDRIKIETDTVETLYAANISGGFYDEPQVHSYVSAKNEALAKQVVAYNKERQAEKRHNYDLYNKCVNDFYAASDEEDKADEDLGNKIKNEVNDSEFAAYLFNDDVYFSDKLTPVEERFAKFTPDVQNSFIGKSIKKVIDIRKHLNEGLPAPEFSIVTDNGFRITSKTFASNYVYITYLTDDREVWKKYTISKLSKFYPFGLKMIFVYAEETLDKKNSNEIKNLQTTDDSVFDVNIYNDENRKFEEDYFFRPPATGTSVLISSTDTLDIVDFHESSTIEAEYVLAKKFIPNDPILKDKKILQLFKNDKKNK